MGAGRSGPVLQASRVGDLRHALRHGEGYCQPENRMERAGHGSRGHNRTAGLSQTATGESEETT